jgi:chemotaxis protein histidine kinase CheA
MTSEHDPVSDRLAALFAEYRNQLPDRMTQIELQFEAVRTDPADAQRLTSLVFSLHRLAGSGATFGFDDITRIARRWEHLIQPRVKDGSAVPATELAEMASLLSELRTAIAAAHKSDL